MADGSTAPGITDADLRTLVLALAPMAALDSIAGLRARYRDPRERPGTGGDQRDAAEALLEASDRGHLTAARAAYARFYRLDADLRATAWWLAQRGGAVRGGVVVDTAGWADTYGAREGPGHSRANDLEARAVAARARLKGLKHRARAGLTPTLAKEIDETRALSGRLDRELRAAQTALAAWGRERFAALWLAWRNL